MRAGLNKAVLTGYEIVTTQKAGKDIKKLKMTFIVEDTKYGDKTVATSEGDMTGKEKWQYYSLTSFMYDKNNERLQGEALEKAKKQWKHQLSMPIACIVGRKTVDKATEGVKSPSDYVQALVDLYNTVDELPPLHIWLEYEYKLQDGKKQTYLQIPLNIRNGVWVSRYDAGDWQLKIDKTADKKVITYVNEKGDAHYISRDLWYYESNYWTKQVAGEKPAEPVPQAPVAVADDDLPF